MGLIEQIQSGALFTRQQVSLTNTPVSGSTTGFGPSYILLGVTANNPCRIRLYSDSASVALDNSRPSSSLNIDAGVGLTFDGTLTDDLSLTFDPPIPATTFSGSKTWYNISASSATSVTFTTYPIEQFADRQAITIQQYASASNVIHEGTFTAPKGFLILSASSNVISRLRLYSVDSSIPLAEKVRPTGSLPADDSKLIVDMSFESASYAYKLSPILEAYNLNSLPNGTNTYSYIIQNRTAANAAVTASLYIYPTES